MFKNLYLNFQQKGIYKKYIYAFISCLTPFVFLLIFLIDEFTFNFTDATFWALFLLALAPCSIIGIIIGIIGLNKSLKENSRKNRMIGTSIIMLATGELIFGVFGMMLIYLVTG
jgi:hypothetical protein